MHALEVFHVLIDESVSLQGADDNYIQFAAVAKTLGNILQYHSSQLGIVRPTIACLAALRDKNDQVTFKALQEELSHTQFIILKQLLQ